jgi:hypothetical protein
VNYAASGKGRIAEMTDSKPPSDSEEWQDEKWYDRTRYQVLLVVGGIVLFVLVRGWILDWYRWILDWYINPHTSGQKKDLVQTLGLLTAGVAGAVGIFFTGRGQRITQERLQQRYEAWQTEMRSYCVETKLGRAEHLWNDYQHRHNLVWNLVFRLTLAVGVLAIIPYTQVEIMKRLGGWILVPPFLGFVLALVGFLRVRREVKLLDHVRGLYRPLQDSLFYEFHGDETSTFGRWVLIYIGILTVLAALNILQIDICWVPKDSAISVFHSSWVCEL